MKANHAIRLLNQDTTDNEPCGRLNYWCSVKKANNGVERWWSARLHGQFLCKNIKFYMHKTKAFWCRCWASASYRALGGGGRGPFLSTN